MPEREEPDLLRAIERGEIALLYCLHGPERFLVDRVVAARVAAKAETETLTVAGVRTGVGRTALGRWLVEAGVERQGYHWRVRAADVDRVVALHRSDVQCRAWRHRVPRC